MNSIIKYVALLTITSFFFIGCTEDKTSQTVLGTLTFEPEKPVGPTWFKTLTAEESGINFINALDDTGRYNVIDYSNAFNGGGVALGDINNDGLPDVILTANLLGISIYINKGNLKFENITPTTGIKPMDGWTTGICLVDVNGDNNLDIYVCRAGWDDSLRHNLLYINNGDLTFTEMGREYGLDDNSPTGQATFFDADNDGDLDVFILNHYTDFKGIYVPVYYKNKKAYNNDYADKFLRNDGNKFTDISKEAGIITSFNFGLSVLSFDINEDGWRDIYVCNDFFVPDQIYINQGDGTFKENIKDYLTKSTLFSMGSDYADINNDGKLDLMVLDMMPSDHYQSKKFGNIGPTDLNKFLEIYFDLDQTSKNGLYIKNDLNQLVDVSYLAGIHQTDWSWGVLLQDFNNDGYNDIYITNGIKRAITDQDFLKLLATPGNLQKYTHNRADLIEKMPPYSVGNHYYLNKGGLKFEDQSVQSGLQHFTASNGTAYADLDLDGDLDLVTNNLDTVSFVIENLSNEQNNENHYIRIKLEGTGKNTDAIGAKIWVYTGDLVKHTEVSISRGFQSSSEGTVHFGLGNNNKVDSITVIWQGGDMLKLENLEVDTVYSLSQSSANKYHDYTIQKKIKPLFTTSTYKSIKSHQEREFNDFKQNRLLPYKLSKEGPGIASGDLNNDGILDLVTSGAAGFFPEVLISKHGSLEKQDLSEFKVLKDMEVMGVLIADLNSDGWKDIYFTSSSNELRDVFKQDIVLYNNKGNGFYLDLKLLPEMNTATSSAVAADYDKDGDIDLFVGGRMTPSNYPQISRSYLLINNDNLFVDATKEVCKDLEYVGNVKSALWTDFDNDTWLDLIVVGDFMPITFFKNNNGKLVNITETTPFSDKKGLWNSINAGDFDNDGDIDYLVGNLGLNSYLKATDKEPITVYLDDFDGNGVEEPICFHYLKGVNAPFADMPTLLEQMPAWKNRFLTFESFARACLNGTVFTQEQLDKAEKFTATYLETAWIENKGNNQFTLKPLPIEAQFAPVYGSVIEDINSDGNLDILLTGNWFSNHYSLGNYDAFTGLTLLGDGNGGFTVMDNKQSGYNNQLDGKSFALHVQDDKPVWLIGNNKAKYKAIEYVDFNDITLYNVPANISYAEITLHNGKTRKQEFYYGQGYLSQNARVIISNPTIKSIKLIDQNGNATMLP